MTKLNDETFTHLWATQKKACKLLKALSHVVAVTCWNSLFWALFCSNYNDIIFLTNSFVVFELILFCYFLSLLSECQCVLIVIFFSNWWDKESASRYPRDFLNHRNIFGLFDRKKHFLGKTHLPSPIDWSLKTYNFINFQLFSWCLTLINNCMTLFMAEKLISILLIVLVNSSTRCCHQNESLVLLQKPQKAKVAHDAVDMFMLPSRCLHVAE